MNKKIIFTLIISIFQSIFSQYDSQIISKKTVAAAF